MSAVLLIVLIVLEVVNLVTSWRLRHYSQRLRDIEAAKWPTHEYSSGPALWTNAHQPLDEKDQR